MRNRKNVFIVIAYCQIMILIIMSITGCTRKHKTYVSSSTEIRDNTPVCLVPEAPGTCISENDYVKIDYSNASEGYINIVYLGGSNSVKLQITGPDYMTYTYDISDNEMETFPISAGNGSYTIGLYELVEGTQYTTVFSEEFEFNVTNEFGAFLYPNQYVKFDGNKKVVKEASQIVADAHDDLEAITKVYNYLIENISYDTEKAKVVQGGYIPDVDQILELKKGICLDYAAVMTSMLRSQRIPTRMEVGYAGTAYHAWISVYADGIGWINGLVEFDGSNWSLMDPTVAANSGQDELAKFIGKGDSYLTQYVY